GATSVYSKAGVYDPAYRKLEVNDDGIGFDPTSASASSFGFRLINSLLRQLDGEMESSNQDGAQFRFQFRDYKKRVA
ncbi:MAG: hypothetical protein AAFN81_31685, partial [Bacteroidota bacterium]